MNPSRSILVNFWSVCPPLPGQQNQPEAGGGRSGFPPPPHPPVPTVVLQTRGCSFKGRRLETLDNSSFQRDLTSRLIFQELWFFFPQIEKGLTQLTDYKNRSIKAIFLLKGKAAKPPHPNVHATAPAMGGSGGGLLLAQDGAEHPLSKAVKSKGTLGDGCEGGSGVASPSR